MMGDIFLLYYYFPATFIIELQCEATQKVSEEYVRLLHCE